MAAADVLLTQTVPTILSTGVVYKTTETAFGMAKGGERRRMKKNRYKNKKMKNTKRPKSKRQYPRLNYEDYA